MTKRQRSGNLSKSKLMAFRQCQKRLWLEVHKPELKEDSAQTQTSYQVGHQVGDIARQLYDPAGRGALINAQVEGYALAFERSKTLLSSRQPLFEAGYSAEGAFAFADVMLGDLKNQVQHVGKMQQSLRP